VPQFLIFWSLYHTPPCGGQWTLFIQNCDTVVTCADANTSVNWWHCWWCCFSYVAVLTLPAVQHRRLECKRFSYAN